MLGDDTEKRSGSRGEIAVVIWLGLKDAIKSIAKYIWKAFNWFYDWANE